MKKQLLVLYIIILTTSSLRASDTAGAFLEKGVQPRAAGLGMGYSALAKGSDAVFWNPAGLAHTQSSDVSAMGYQGFETNTITLQGALPVSTPWGKVVLGTAYISSRLDGIQFATLDSVTDRAQLGDQGSYSGTGYLISIGMPLTSQLSLGSTLKVIQETAAQYSSSGIGLDIGAQYALTPRITVAGTLQNLIQPSMGWNTPSKNVDTIPLVSKLGLGIQIIPDQLMMSTDLVYRRNSFAIQGGMEYWLSSQLPIRVGINRDEWSVGTGLVLSQMSVDFAWTRPNQLEVSDIYRISLTLGGF